MNAVIKYITQTHTQYCNIIFCKFFNFGCAWGKKFQWALFFSIYVLFVIKFMLKERLNNTMRLAEMF